MRSIHQWFDAYGESHQNGFNKFMHWLCVPSITFSLIGLLSLVPLPLPGLPSALAHAGTLFVAAVLLFYARLSWPMTLGMTAVGIGMLWANMALASLHLAPYWMICTGIFVAAWVGQFYGHKVEGKKPSFLQDLQFLMIGPAWLLGFVYRKLGIPY